MIRTTSRYASLEADAVEKILYYEGWLVHQDWSREEKLNSKYMKVCRYLRDRASNSPGRILAHEVAEACNLPEINVYGKADCCIWSLLCAMFGGCSVDFRSGWVDTRLAIDCADYIGYCQKSMNRVMKLQKEKQES